MMGIPFDTFLLVIVLLAGFYMAWNIGANDVANAMGTSVGSGALSLRQAVCIAAVLEFCGAFFFGSHVSETIQSGLVEASVFQQDPYVLVVGMLSCLLSAGLWLQVASYFGWPVSTTHTIVGAVVGFGAIIGGVNAVYWENVFFIVTSWVLSPLFGGTVSYLIFNALRKYIFYTKSPVAATKRSIPFIVFAVFAILSLMVVYKGLENLEFEPTFLQALGISLIIGTFGALISSILMRYVSDPVHLEQDLTSPEVLYALEKAKQQLQKVKHISSAEMDFQINNLIENMDSISHSLQNSSNLEAIKSEYTTVERLFGFLQILSACLMAFAHGANDVANAIGPLAAAVEALQTKTIVNQAEVPLWALALGGFGIVVGLATWGWRVIETIGKKITELTPTRGFSAEFGTAATVLIASRLGLPISTTHTLVGSVIGVGLARGIEALNLGMTRDIALSWIVTVPTGAVLAVIFYYILHALLGI